MTSSILTSERLVVGTVGVAYALAALAVAWSAGQGTTYAGQSGIVGALTVIAGLALILGGLFATSVGSTRTLGRLSVLAGFVWFAPIWEGWRDGPALVRSIGAAVPGFTLALLLHLIVAYPTGLVKGRFERLVLVAAYAEASLVAIGRALFRDPFFDVGCWSNCTDNVFLLHSYRDLARAIAATDRWFAAMLATAAAVSLLRRLVIGSTTARRLILPITLPAITLVSWVWARAISLQRLPREDPADPFFFAIYIVGSVSVGLLGFAVIAAAGRLRLRRRAVARIASDLGEAPAPGSLEAALSRAVGDPDLRIAYWLPASDAFVDASGRRVPEPAASPGRSVTTLVRDERRVAVVSHVATLPSLGSELGTAVRLGLENERLQAEALAHLTDLRASRARIVETGDAERRRLERDLHDGAQQRLLALSYDIRLALSVAENEGDQRTTSVVREALEQSQEALTELRELAHGIYPAILAEAGLGPALETLADAASLAVDVRDTVTGRCSAAAEDAAYLVAADGIRDAAERGATFAEVSTTLAHGSLVVTVEDDGADRTSSPIALADRLGAVGGELVLEPGSIRGKIPCA